MSLDENFWRHFWHGESPLYTFRHTLAAWGLMVFIPLGVLLGVLDILGFVDSVAYLEMLKSQISSW